MNEGREKEGKGKGYGRKGRLGEGNEREGSGGSAPYLQVMVAPLLTAGESERLGDWLTVSDRRDSCSHH